MTGLRHAVPTIEKTRSDRLIQELDHDPYHAKLKLSEPTHCPECGAVFRHGRWTRGDAPENADSAICPACQRARDRGPAGFLTVGGAFFADHRDEILQLIHNTIEREHSEHPLKRLMDVEDKGDHVVFSFTDPHLVRGVGHALHSAYKGDLEFEYQQGEILVRATWTR